MAALQSWAATAERDPKRAWIWICSLCLNQNNFAERMQKHGVYTPEALAAEFGDRVVAIGRILP